MLKNLSSFLIALTLGAVAVMGFAPFYIFPLTIFSLAGITYLWIKASNPKSSWLLGFSYGLGLYCVGIYWIYISLHDFGGMPWWFAGFCTFCLCAFMAIFVGLVGWFAKKLGHPLFSIPVLWGLSDWVRSWIFTGFPWLTIGYSQVPHSPLTGYMPIVGVYGVSVITAFIGTLISYWIANRPQALIWKRNAIITFTVIFVVGGILKVVEWTTPIGKPFSVSLIQGNIPQDIKWSPEVAQGTIDQYLRMTKASNAQLIILPETALPVIASQLDPSVKTALTDHAKQNGGDILVGLVQVNSSVTQPDYDRYYNSAISFGSAETQYYSKNHLVPFGEFIPLKQLLGWIYRDWLHMPLSDLSRGGTHQQPISLDHQKIAVNICYEDVFGEEIIRQLPTATLLVNMSNDAWYGNSYAADQHMQFSQARALETGRMMLRATNTGATAAIDQHGYVLAHAPHDTQTTLDVTAQSYTGSTPYVRWGNWPFILLCFGAITFVVQRRNSSKKMNAAPIEPFDTKAQPYAKWLWLCTSLFAFRVVAQLAALLFQPSFLPAFESWHSGVLPYPLLLSTQILIFIWLAWTARQFSQSKVNPRRRLGMVIIILASLYFLLMLLRLLLGLTILSEQRWFASYLPTFFHLVLACYLFLYGHFHYRHGK